MRPCRRPDASHRHCALRVEQTQERWLLTLDHARGCKRAQYFAFAPPDVFIVRGCAPDRPARRRARKQACGIERRQRRIRIVHDQRNLGAAEYHGITGFALHPPDDALKARDSLVGEEAIHHAVQRKAAPDGWCCRGRSGNRLRLSRTCVRRRASAHRRPASHRRRSTSCTRRESACASRLRDARTHREAARLPRKWSDSRELRPRRSRQQYRRDQACSCREFTFTMRRIHATTVPRDRRVDT